MHILTERRRRKRRRREGQHSDRLGVEYERNEHLEGEEGEDGS